ncbi:outer membrane lipoprotein carrier protein LolA [Thermodesulfobacteriota bacterium]
MNKLPRYFSKLSAMGVIAFSLLSIVFFPLFEEPVFAGEPLTGILDGILKRYGGLPGLTVAYKREIITKSMAMLDDQMNRDPATGNFFFKPPNYLRVEQETPRPETVTTDGDTLWWYIPKKSLVYQYPSNKLGKELRLLSDIFQGLSKVGEGFDVVQSDLEDEREYHLKMIPNPHWEEIDHIDLTVDRGRFTIRLVEIHNFVGSVTRFILGEFSVRESFERGFFRFTVPEGIKVIKEDG